MTRPTETFTRELKPNGNYGKTVKKHSYIVALCERGGASVQAIRVEYYTSFMEARKDVERQFPTWKIKNINRLYDSDFEEEANDQK